MMFVFEYMDRRAYYKENRKKRSEKYMGKNPYQDNDLYTVTTKYYR
jgi:hypothetical protein